MRGLTRILHESDYITTETCHIKPRESLQTHHLCENLEDYVK